MKPGNGLRAFCIRYCFTLSTSHQKRIASPGQAIRDGADHIVVGRPVWQAEDPRAAARAIAAELPLRG
jgi:orotidine-5'-phosphate decarboxylase